MAERISLRDYQRDLVARLRSQEGVAVASKLGLQAGNEAWLVDLSEAGEVLPVPPISELPLTRPWFKGLANIRGNLYSVIDFSAFLGGTPVLVTPESRLLLIGDRFRLGAALLVDRSLGLRNSTQLRSVAEGDAARWTRTEYEDTEGKRWRELDVPLLAQHQDFLSVGV
jgi:twitching motility protein PilI